LNNLFFLNANVGIKGSTYIIANISNNKGYLINFGLYQICNIVHKKI